jgi:hypothetical protein
LSIEIRAERACLALLFLLYTRNLLLQFHNVAATNVSYRFFSGFYLTYPFVTRIF